MKCKYCNKPAGLFKKVHEQCDGLFKEGIQKLNETFSLALTEKIDTSYLDKFSDELLKKHFVDITHNPTLLANQWMKTLEDALEDNVLTENEEVGLRELAKHFSLEKVLEENGSDKKLNQASYIRCLMKGNAPEIKKPSWLNIVLEKEQLRWIWKDVGYLEERKRTHYQGGSTGASFRVAKGVYLRTSSFKGYPVVSKEITKTDAGILVLTDKHIYFSGSSKAFKIKLDKILVHEPYTDGMKIQKDGVSAKPLLFTIEKEDGWFLNNLVNISLNKS